jgi:hypothetical protein
MFDEDTIRLAARLQRCAADFQQRPGQIGTLNRPVERIRTAVIEAIIDIWIEMETNLHRIPRDAQIELRFPSHGFPV